MRETWTEIEEYDNYYVSDQGRILNDKSGRILKPIFSGQYLAVRLYKNSGSKNEFIHRLVATAFLGHREGMIVNHKDLDKTNNCLDNLEWISQSQNVKHAYAHKSQLWARGVPVRVVELNKTFDSVSECARYVDGSILNIRACMDGKRKEYRGYTFEYA